MFSSVFGLLRLILPFAIVLSVLIVAHEYGHFLAARAFGVRVLTFSLGFGKKIWSRKRGDTEYCLSVLPLGGYVRLLGDDPKEVLAEEDQKHSFLAQPGWKKFLIVAAGPGFNFLLAMVVFVLLALVGTPVFTPQIGKVESGTPAHRAGLIPGDLVTAIDGKPIRQWDEIKEVLQRNDGREMIFTILRNNESLEAKITPGTREDKTVFGEPRKVYYIGVLPKGETTIRRYDPISAVGVGIARTVQMSYLTVLGIWKLLVGQVPSSTIGGPILILQMTEQQVSQGILPVLFFVALLSINLGVINLLPIPVLDGGHLLRFLIEGITRKPLSIKNWEIAQQIGFFILISIMLYATYNDLMRWFLRG